MKTLAIGDLKTHFSDVLAAIKEGQSVTVGYGKTRRKVAVIVPYAQYCRAARRKIGLLQRHGRCRIHPDFKLSDEEVMSS